MWSYPAVTPTLRDLIMTKCTLSKDKEGEGQEEGLAFTFGHTHQVWYYLTNFTVGEATTLPRVRSV